MRKRYLRVGLAAVIAGTSIIGLRREEDRG